MEIPENIAKELCGQILHSSDLLCSTANLVRANCSAEVFNIFQREVANIVSEIGDRLLSPIYIEHQHLCPWQIESK